MVRWTVYSRADCSLCEHLLTELAELLGPEEASQVLVVDIDNHPKLHDKYGARIPVLLADDEVVCTYRLDEGRVRAVSEAATRAAGARGT